MTARRIAWTKLLNSGQTCIAPDYVLADPSVVDTLVAKIGETIAEFRADKTEPTVPIVNQRQFERLSSYLQETTGRVALGGGIDRENARIEPTIVLDPDPGDALMENEIFGPILPVITIDSPDAAIAFVNGRPKPLASYVFTSSKALAQRMIDSIPSGGAVVNHIAMHCLIPQLPFGGVGASGMGAYHGKWGFEALSHRKAVLAKPAKPDLSLIYPPYSDRASSCCAGCSEGGDMQVTIDRDVCCARRGTARWRRRTCSSWPTPARCRSTTPRWRRTSTPCVGRSPSARRRRSRCTSSPSGTLGDGVLDGACRCPRRRCGTPR